MRSIKQTKKPVVFIITPAFGRLPVAAGAEPGRWPLDATVV